MDKKNKSSNFWLLIGQCVVTQMVTYGHVLQKKIFIDLTLGKFANCWMPVIEDNCWNTLFLKGGEKVVCQINSPVDGGE